MNTLNCPNGHPWTLATTRIDTDGKRRCRICRTAAVAKHRAKSARPVKPVPVEERDGGHTPPTIPGDVNGMPNPYLMGRYFVLHPQRPEPEADAPRLTLLGPWDGRS